MNVPETGPINPESMTAKAIRLIEGAPERPSPTPPDKELEALLTLRSHWIEVPGHEH